MSVELDYIVEVSWTAELNIVFSSDALKVVSMFICMIQAMIL
jgi:hypothetical protein